MLRIFLFLILSVYTLSACDIDESMRAKSQNPTSAKILAIAAKNGCMGCHAVNTSIIGPAWTLVADRYEGQAEARTKLIEKIKKGGGGNWNTLTGGAKMPSHEGVPDDDIARIVDYILGLNNKNQL
ncbi:MAG: c-type cytochrome [Gammaproteobacteria bacterium]|nr:c-type cytochrome [Gammaproteobacteria bacterium]